MTQGTTTQAVGVILTVSASPHNLTLSQSGLQFQTAAGSVALPRPARFCFQSRLWRAELFGVGADAVWRVLARRHAGFGNCQHKLRPAR